MARGMDHIELNWRHAHSSQQEHRHLSPCLALQAGDHASLCERGHMLVHAWPEIWTAHMMDGWIDPLCSLHACMRNPSCLRAGLRMTSRFTLAKGPLLPACSPAPPPAAPRPAGLLLLINPRSSRLTTHPGLSIARISCTPWPWLIRTPTRGMMVQAKALPVRVAPCVCFVFADQIDVHGSMHAWPDCLVHGNSRGSCLEGFLASPSRSLCRKRFVLRCAIISRCCEHLACTAGWYLLLVEGSVNDAGMSRWSMCVDVPDRLPECRKKKGR
jgi:hypothetical protein